MSSRSQPVTATADAATPSAQPSAAVDFADLIDPPEAPPAPPTPWTQAEAIELCRLIEAVCPTFGCHVALTGGCLYKDGERKDLDILFYRIRQVYEIDADGLWQALEKIGVVFDRGFGWCCKATFNGRSIDCFFPEEEGEYPPCEDAASLRRAPTNPEDEVVF